MRSPLLLALVLAACTDSSGDSDKPVVDDTTPEDTGPEPCVTTVLGTEPEDAETGVYYRGTIEISFDGDGSRSDVIEVRDASGTAVPAELSWSDGNVQAFLDVVLEPSTPYTLHVEVCDVTTEVGFTTSDLGTPLAIPAGDLVDRTYVWRLSDARITEPAFLDAVAGSYLTVPLLIGVTAADDAEIDFLGALGELEDDGSYTQLTAYPTWDFPPADFTETPYFEAYAESITIMYGDIPIPIEDFSLAGTFTSDGSRIEMGTGTGFGDSRHMGALVGREDDPDAICEIAEAAGVECEDCSDGEPYCMYIVAEEISAEWETGLVLTVVE